jgi:predicted peroxiredoxin
MYELEHAAPGIAAAGVEVINCSPGTALRCFRQARLEDAIE